MRALLFSLLTLLLAFPYGAPAHAEAAATAFSANLSLGSSGAQVLALQQFLNSSSDTQIASVGAGSPGYETGYFGALTKAAVIRFQNKYAASVLAPAGLARGNGFVGAYTRAKLNALALASASPAATTAVTPMPALHGSDSTNTTGVTTSTNPLSSYMVAPNDQTDIYAGDTLLAKIRSGVIADVNAAIASRGAAGVSFSDVQSLPYPMVGITSISGQSGLPGTKITLAGIGITGLSSVYFGSNYLVRTLQADAAGNLYFTIPPIPPGLYDMAIKNGSDISGTIPLVVMSAGNPAVHIDSVSPASVTYGGTLTINGSGFTPENNMVYVSYQDKVAVPSSDGKTLVVTVAPASLKYSAQIGNGMHPVQMTVSVVNSNGFSDAIKSFTLSL